VWTSKNPEDVLAVTRRRKESSFGTGVSLHKEVPVMEGKSELLALVEYDNTGNY